LLAVIAATWDAGVITVRAASPGLQAATQQLTAVPATPAISAIPGVPAEQAADPANRDTPALYGYGSGLPDRAPARDDNSSPDDRIGDIPVRKLEIVCPQGNLLTPANRQLPVHVKLHPANA